VPNADGSIDIYIQNTPPAGHESNWLPRRHSISYSGCASEPGAAILDGS